MSRFYSCCSYFFIDCRGRRRSRLFQRHYSCCFSLNQRAVCLSSPVLLRQFLTSIFISVDICSKEGELFCDVICDKGPLYDGQVGAMSSVTFGRLSIFRQLVNQPLSQRGNHVKCRNGCVGPGCVTLQHSWCVTSQTSPFCVTLQTSLLCVTLQHSWCVTLHMSLVYDVTAFLVCDCVTNLPGV